MIITKYKNPVLFYSIATLIPWAFWFTAGYISHLTPHSDQNLRIASILGFIGLLGPMGVTYWFASRDSALRYDILGRICNFSSFPPIYLILSFILMPASILLAQAVSLLFGYSASQFVITGHFTFSSGIFPVWFMLIMAPVIEELAWHSYGTDCLRNRMNLFKTSLLFGVFWGIWHIPLSTIRDYYQSNLVETGWIYSVNFLVSIVPYVLLMNWLYYKTNRNIFIAIIFHITAGYFNEIFATHPDSKIIQTGLLLILAAILILREKDFFFNRDLAGIDPPYSSIDKVDGPGDSWRRSYECRYASHQWTQRYERTIEKEKMETKELIQSRVHTYYWQDDINCATTNLKILSEVFSIPLSDQVTDAALGMHGAGEYGAQCGLVEGTLMFLGIIGRTKGISDEKIIDSCNAFARQFEHKFQTLLCRELRPEGFHRNNPPHLCEKFTCEAVLFNIDFVTDFTNNY